MQFNMIYANALDGFFKAITGTVALIIYISILFVLIIVVLLDLMINKIKNLESLDERYENDIERERKSSVEDINKTIEKSFKGVSQKIESLDEQLEVIQDRPIGSTQTINDNRITSETNIEAADNSDVVEVSNGDSRFYMLTQIDLEMENYIKPNYDELVSLEELCKRFRNYAAHDLKLYYDIKDIRRFIAGLAVTKLLILQGMSGTGKTSLAYAFGEFLNNKTVVVPIQPMWKERTDLIGYYNEFTKKFNETTLLYKMYEADYTKNVYITVLDEMNIARVEYYFAEFLSLLELPNPDGRNLDVVSDVWDNDPKLLYKGKLRLPINMWFIGTANNDDSTFAISDKVYDRAMVLNLDTKAEVFEGEDVGNTLLSIDHLYDLFKKAEKEFEISDRNLRRIKKLDKYMVDTFHITFGNRIMKQIKAYVPVIVSCGGTELDAIDDILSRKVLRKLESKNPVYVRSQSEALMDFIDDLFGIDKMPLCKETIRQIVLNV